MLEVFLGILLLSLTGVLDKLFAAFNVGG